MRIKDARIEAVKQNNPMSMILRRELGEPNGRGFWFCPFHNDRNNPNLHVIPDSGDQLFKCFRCGATGNVMQLIQFRRGCSFGKAVDFLENSNGGGPFPPLPSPRGATSRKQPKLGPPPAIPESEILKCHRRLLKDHTRVDQLRAYRGWSEGVIREYRIGLKGSRITIPVADLEGHYPDCRLYLPNAKKDVQKMLAWEKGRGQPRLFPINVLRENEEVWLVEGEPDCLRMLSEGYPAVTNTNGANTWEDEWRREFKGKGVVLALDNDEAGRKGTELRRKALTGIARRIDIINWRKWSNA